MEVAEARANIYGFLSAVYSSEPTMQLLRKLRAGEFVRTLGDMGLELERSFLEKKEEELLEELVLEYTRLFIGPGRHVQPYESVWSEEGGQRGLLWSEATADVQAFVKSLGLRYKRSYSSLPDHIGVELELMQKLALKELACRKEHDREGALRCLELSKQFLEEHLGRWVPSFCREVISESEGCFYGQVARLTQEYVSFDSGELERAFCSAAEGAGAPPGGKV